MKRVLTLLVVLVVMVGALCVVGQAATTETLTANVDSKTISEDTELNLAGYSIGTLTVEEGATVTITGVGTTGVITTVNGGGRVQLADGYMYLGSASNKLVLKTAGVSLRTENLDQDGAGIYYTSTFGGNQAVLNNIQAYGTALYLGTPDNLFKGNTYTRTVKGDADFEWNTGVEKFNATSVLLSGIVKTRSSYSLNKSNASKQIYSVPYVELTDGTRIMGSTVNRSLRNVLESATSVKTPGSDYWDGYSDPQKENVIYLCDTFKQFMSFWDLGRLKPLYSKAAGETFYICDNFDAKLISTITGADIQLKANIDLKGATIDGLTNFTGSIAGNGYTISNATINGVGLVDTVAAGETITNLHLRNVNIVVPADATATAAGTIAGTNKGTITGSTAIGSVKDTRSNVALGALVGKNTGSITTGTLTVTNTVNTLATDGSGIGKNNTTYTTTNLAAAVGLYADGENVTRGLVGSGNAVANAASVYWRDSSYSTDRQAQALQDRRQAVVDDVYAQGTIRWTVPSTITYYNDQKTQPSFNKGDREWVQTGEWPWQGKWVGTYHIHNQQFNPGTVYNGIPYAHTSSTIEQAKFYMTEGSNGVYTLKSEIASLSGGSNYTVGDATWNNGHANGGLGWAKYLGSDCSAALTMAWHKVSPVRDLNRTANNKGTCLYYTTNIVPTEFNQWNYGFDKVGDYTVDDKALATTYELTGTDFTTNDKAQTKTNYPINTNMIVADIIENQGGVNTVYEAYAKAQKGDIMISSGSAGHTRMLAEDPVVVRNAAGIIDPAKSYFITHEQGDGLYERANTLSSWRINYKYTFEQLAYQNTEGLTGSSGYYLPITMKAFHDTSVTSSGQVTLNNGRAIGTTNDPSYVVLNSSFRIQSATMTIMDAPNGNVLYQKTAYQGTSKSSNRYRAVPGYITMWMDEFFSDYGTNLTAGKTYYFTLSGTTYTNATPKNVYTNEAFVYTPAA